MPRHDVLSELRLNARRAAALRRAGMIDLRQARGLAGASRAARTRGPLAGTAIGAALRFGDRPILTDDRGTISARELDERSNALARHFAETGIEAGAAVGVMARTHRGLLEAMIGASKAGLRVVLLNTGFAAPQLADVARREQIVVGLFDREFEDRIPGGLRQHICTWSDDGRPGAADTTIDAIAAHTSGAPVPVPARKPSMIILTSGTTGTPKGAPREEVSPLAAFGPLFERIPLRAGETTFVAPPIFHSLGLLGTISSLNLGSRIVTQRRFDPEQALAAMARERVTTAVVVPAMLQRIFELSPDVVGRYDLSALRVVLCAGSQLPGRTAEDVLAAWGDVLYVLYGSTECAMVSISTPADHRAAATTVGRPVLGARVRILDAQDRDVAPGQTGTIFAANGVEFSGYTDGSSKRIVDGLMSTGDVGHMDAEGRLFIDGRDDDMIVSGGENVFPQEVEDTLLRHPDVADAAVVGVEDEAFGARLRAFVVPAAGATVDADELRHHVRATLAGYKVPRDVLVVEELPRNATGKVLKRVLRDREAIPA